MPPSQSTQASDPFVALYLPASHATHTPPSGPEYPALHEQMLLPPPAVLECAYAGHALHVDPDVPPVSLLYLPVGQIKHAMDPLTLLYVPAGHSVHADPSGPVSPGPHLHCKMSLLEGPEVDPDGHAAQVLLLAAPTAPE